MEYWFEIARAINDLVMYRCSMGRNSGAKVEERCDPPRTQCSSPPARHCFSRARLYHHFFTLYIFTSVGSWCFRPTYLNSYPRCSHPFVLDLYRRPSLTLSPGFPDPDDVRLAYTPRWFAGVKNRKSSLPILCV